MANVLILCALQLSMTVLGSSNNQLKDDTSTTCTHGTPASVNPGLFGYNLEAYGTMMPNTFDDTAFIAAIDALKPGSLRYPGGTMSNVWDLVSGRYVPNVTSFGFDWTTMSGYEKFVPFAEKINAEPLGTFSAKRFATSVGKQLKTIVYDLNIYTFNASEACARIAEIAAIHKASLSETKVLLEFGNEIFDSDQGLPRFHNAKEYIEAMMPIHKCARAMLGTSARLAVAGCLGSWSQGLGNMSQDLSAFDAVSYHQYSPSVTTVGALPQHEQISYVAAYSRATLRQMIATSTTQLKQAKPIWHTEFNYGILSGATPTFLPKLEFGGLHGIFHAARILAAINSNNAVEVLQFQTLAHPVNYSMYSHAFHEEMPVVRISHIPNRPDLAIIAGTGQLVAHLSHIAMEDNTQVVAMACTSTHTGPDVLGEVQPCVQAVLFTRDTHTSTTNTYAVLNVCNTTETLNANNIIAPTTLDITTYNANDEGGWAPLPANASDLPWKSGPLTPDTTQTMVHTTTTVFTIPPLSFNFYRLAHNKL